MKWIVWGLFLALPALGAELRYFEDWTSGGRPALTVSGALGRVNTD